jgi:DNA-binding NarL/FixJ family response regulator
VHGAQGEFLVYYNNHKQPCGGLKEMTVPKARVFIADDQARVRWALRTFLQEEQGLILVGETSRSDTLLPLVEGSRPDLLLLDWGLLNEPVDQLLSTLRGFDFQVKVIILSSQPDIQQVALAAGVEAFVSKSDPPECLLTTLRAIQQDIKRLFPGEDR